MRTSKSAWLRNGRIDSSALHVEAGIDGFDLGPRGFCFVDAAEVAVAGREQDVGRLRVRIALKPLIEYCNRLLEPPERDVCLGEEMQQDVRIMRVEPHRGLDVLDRGGRFAVEYLRVGQGDMALRGARRQLQATRGGGQRPVQVVAPQGGDGQREIAFGLLGIHLNCAFGDHEPLSERALGIVAPTVDVVDRVGESDQSVRRCVVRFDGDRGGEQPTRIDVSRLLVLPSLLAAAQVQIVGVEVDRALVGQTLLLVRGQPDLERGDDLPGQLILDGENVGEVTVEPVGPDVAAIGRVDELCGDAHAVARLAHAALQHVAHTQFTARPRGSRPRPRSCRRRWSCGR